ncbi:hypothetical protein YC2023_064261 [Brassica napus]
MSTLGRPPTTIAASRAKDPVKYNVTYLGETWREERGKQRHKQRDAAAYISELKTCDGGHGERIERVHKKEGGF